MAIEENNTVQPAIPRPITWTVDHIGAQLFRIEQAVMIVEEFMDVYQGDPRHAGVCARVAFCGLLVHESVAEIEKLLAGLLYAPAPE